MTQHRHPDAPPVAAAPSRPPWPGDVPSLAPPVLPFDGRRILLRTLLGLFAAIVLFATIVRIDRVVIGTGTIVGADERVDVRAPVGGVIEAVLVSPGEQVRADQPLLRLDAADARGRHELVKREIEEARRLAAETAAACEAMEAAIRSEEPGAVAEGAAAETLLTWRRTREEVSRAERRLRTLVPKEKALGEARIEREKAAVRTCASELARADEELRLIEALVEKGASAETRLRDAAGAREAALGRLRQAESSVMVERERLAVLETEAALALEAARAAHAVAVAALADERERLEGAAQAWEAKRIALIAEGEAALSGLERLTIRSPAEGLVVFATDLHGGDRIEAGQEIASVSRADAVSATAFFANRDAGRLTAGSPCKVKIDAYPYQDFGVIPGRIESIALEPEIDPRTECSVYSVQVALGRTRTDGAPPGGVFLTPGLTLTVEVVSDRPRLLTMLFEPIRRLSRDRSEPTRADPTPVGGGEGSVPEAEQARKRFDSARAFQDVERLVGLGPRPAGSEGLVRAAAYVRSELEAAGVSVEERPFDADTPDGPARLRNLLGHLERRGKGGAVESGAILLGTHLDSRKIAALPDFVGANDGGTGAAVLLETARALAGAASRPEITFAFFDGKEPVGRWGPTDGLYGSRRMARRIVAEGGRGRYAAVIVIGMVGDCDLTFTDEQRSTTWLADRIVEAGRRIGHGQRFERGKEGTIPLAITDDHIPFCRLGIPACMIGDFDYGGPDPVRRMARNRYRHTESDTLEKVCPESLGVSGEIIIEVVYDIAFRETKAP